MFLKGWRLLAIVFAALSLAPALGHLLEMPAKMSYDGAMWLAVQQTLYGAFGVFGAAFEVGALIAVVVLVWLVRRRPPSFRWTFAAAACMAAAHAAFWIWLAPVNATVAALTPQTLPADWTSLRSQWENAHAARALLQIGVVFALAMSVLVETPDDAPRHQPTR
jgi:hypothetical protein